MPWSAQTLVITPAESVCTFTCSICQINVVMIHANLTSVVSFVSKLVCLSCFVSPPYYVSSPVRLCDSFILCAHNNIIISMVSFYASLFIENNIILW